VVVVVVVIRMCHKRWKEQLFNLNNITVISYSNILISIYIEFQILKTLTYSTFGARTGSKIT